MAEEILEGVSFRIDPDLKRRAGRMGKQLGYRTFTAFMVSLLRSLVERFDEDEWRSGTVAFDGDRMLGEPLPSERLGSVSFPLVAPARFWRYVEHLQQDRLAVILQERTAKIRDASGSEEAPSRRSTRR